MAGAVETLTLDQLPQWADRQERSLPQLDYGPVFATIKVLLSSYTKQNFDGSHEPDGTPWLKLQHPRPRGGDKPLRDTGLLMASVVGNGPDHYERIEKARMEWGTNLDYAGVHQEGALIHHPEQTRPYPAKPWVFLDPDSNETVFTRRIRAHDVLIPARPFLGINDELAGDITEAVGEFVARNAG